ncbi:MAG: class I SAM-dependent methyltransferase, partial [Nitrososphaerota archaeon]
GWLSLKLFKWGYEVVGIDISPKMVNNAKLICPEADFVVADGENLPFKDNIFDYVIGVSILHHISNLRQALLELRRIMVDGCGFMFMEPNMLNPISAIGRRIFPMEVHTKGEKQFTPMSLEDILKPFGFKVKNRIMLFLIAFPLARLFKILRKNIDQFLVRFLYVFELSMEKNMLMRYLNSTIIVSGLLDKTVDFL